MESVMAQEAQHLAEEARIRFGRTDDQVDRSPRIKISASTMAGHFHVYAIQHVTQPDPLAVVKIGNKQLTATRWYEHKKQYEHMIITCTILY